MANMRVILLLAFTSCLSCDGTSLADVAVKKMNKTSKITMGYYASNANWKKNIERLRSYCAGRLLKFFDIKLLEMDKPLDPNVHYDIIAWDGYRVFDNWVIDMANRPPVLAGYIGDPVINTFESKQQWKGWMRQHGMEDVIPATYTLENATFPCIYKQHFAHFGSGVKVAYSVADVKSFVAANNSTNNEYFLEEVLSGSGMASVTAYGGAFMGKLTSLRCKVYHYDQEETNKKDRSVGRGNIFVAGQDLQSSNASLVVCSMSVVRQVSRMMNLAKYTGAFCVDIKLDSLGNMKFMEVNARMCASMVTYRSLFLSTYLPLAFHVQAHLNPKLRPNLKGALSLTSKRRNDTAEHWYDDDYFLRVIRHENRVLHSGGTGKQSYTPTDRLNLYDTYKEEKYMHKCW